MAYAPAGSDVRRVPLGSVDRGPTGCVGQFPPGNRRRA
jgi:hypothetical protein